MATYRVLLPSDLHGRQRPSSPPALSETDYEADWVEPLVIALKVTDPGKVTIFSRANEDIVFSSVFTVNVLFPKNFEELRVKEGFPDNVAFSRSIATASLLKVFAGRSGGDFYATSDNRLMIKEVPDGDYNAIASIGRKYFQHVATEETCMAKILGAFKVAQLKMKKATTCNLVVMERVALPPDMIERAKFDLKGLARSYKPGARGYEYSDAAFKVPFPLAGSSHDRFFGALERDLKFLKEEGLVDYSLIVYRTDGFLVVGLVDYLGYLYAWDNWRRIIKNFAVIVKYNCRKEVAVIHSGRYSRRMLNVFRKYFPRG